MTVGMDFRRLSDKDIAEVKGLKDVAMATNFGTKFAINGFVSKITTTGLWKGV